MRSPRARRFSVAIARIAEVLRLDRLRNTQVGAWCFEHVYWTYKTRIEATDARALMSYAPVRQSLRRTQQVATIFGALIATGTGFIAHVANPASYMLSYALVIIMLYLFEVLVVDHRESIGCYALFGAALAIGALVYDALPLYIVFLVYGWARRVNLRWTVLAIVGAAAYTWGFIFLHDVVLGLDIVPTNSQQLDIARNGFIDVLAHPSLTTWSSKLWDAITAYPALLARMFFVVPVVMALFGIRFARSRPIALLAAALVGVSFATIAFLRIGGQNVLGSLPRFTYLTYPAIYLLGALALGRLGQLQGPPRLTRYAPVLPWIVVGLVFVLSNVDSFGYTRLYYEALLGGPPGFVPRAEP